MDYLYIGKIVNTHGIKGEVRIISDFEYKDKVFKNDMYFYIGENHEKLLVTSYRPHKNFDMVTFENLSDINDVLKYKGKKVYVKKSDIDLGENILDEDLIGVSVFFKDKEIGKIIDIINNNGYKLFNINDILIPYKENFIEKLSKEKIILKNVEELIK